MDNLQIGARIRSARIACGINTLEKLGEMLKISRQMVANWENGKNPLPLKRVGSLAEIFKQNGRPEFNEEWILFGIRREEQLRREKRYLQYIDDKEADLLTLFWSSNPMGREMMLDTAKTIAKHHPNPLTPVLAFKGKRKGDPR